MLHAAHDLLLQVMLFGKQGLHTSFIKIFFGVESLHVSELGIFDSGLLFDKCTNCVLGRLAVGNVQFVGELLESFHVIIQMIIAIVKLPKRQLFFLNPFLKFKGVCFLSTDA